MKISRFVMFNLILNTFRLLFLSIVLPIRKKSKHKISYRGIVYSQGFQHKGKSYYVAIEETIFRVKYKCWLIPNIKESVYKTAIYDDETHEILYSEHYPLLSLSSIVDPQYPLSCIAQIHIEEFVQRPGVK